MAFYKTEERERKRNGTVATARKEMLKPEDNITRRKNAAKKPRVKVRDLIPRKETRGGGLVYPSDPPLPIPPRGFVKGTDEGKDD